MSQSCVPHAARVPGIINDPVICNFFGSLFEPPVRISLTHPASSSREMDQFCLDREEEEEKGLDDYIDLTNFYLRILFNYREKEGSIEGTELNISWWFLLLKSIFQSIDIGIHSLWYDYFNISALKCDHFLIF